jgi:hypothetical protein
MAAPAPNNYESYYQSLSGVTTNANFLGLFDTASPATPGELLSALMCSESVPCVILYCTGTAAAPTIRCIHRLSFYGPILGHPTVWDNQRLAFAGDIGPGGSIQAVIVPPNLLSLTMAVHVHTVATIQGKIANTYTNNLHCLGKNAAGAANTEAVITQLAMPVPPQYAAFMMEQVEYPPIYFLAWLLAKLTTRTSELCFLVGLGSSGGYV